MPLEARYSYVEPQNGIRRTWMLWSGISGFLTLCVCLRRTTKMDAIRCHIVRVTATTSDFRLSIITARTVSICCVRAMEMNEAPPGLLLASLSLIALGLFLLVIVLFAVLMER